VIALLLKHITCYYCVCYRPGRPFDNLPPPWISAVLQGGGKLRLYHKSTYGVVNVYIKGITGVLATYYLPVNPNTKRIKL